jgi:ferredoxin-thioredoxin reductase catalytic subunit
VLAIWGGFFCQYPLSHIGMRLGEPRFGDETCPLRLHGKKEICMKRINVNCPGFYH